MRSLNTTPNVSQVKSAHDLAETLKRAKPQLRPQVDELQRIINISQLKLMEATTQSEALDALDDIEATFRALKQLKHRKTK